MEKQNLEDLKQITAGYSVSAGWLSILMLGVLYMVIGILTYFSFAASIISILIIIVSCIVFPAGAKYLNRIVMRKGLGYVRQKGEIASIKQELSRQQILIILLGPCLLVIFLLSSLSYLTFFSLIFLTVGLIMAVIALVNRERHFFYNFCCLGLYFIICAILLMLPPTRHMFYSSTSTSYGFIIMAAGFSNVLSGIVLYVQHKNVIRTIKTLNPTNE